MAPSHCLSVGQDSHNAAQSTHSHSLQTGRRHRACVRATHTRHPSQQEHTFSCHVSRMPHEFSVGSAKPRYMYLTSTSSSSLDSVSTAFCTSAALNRVSTSRTREKLLACSKQHHTQSGEGHCYRASRPRWGAGWGLRQAQRPSLPPPPPHTHTDTDVKLSDSTESAELLESSLKKQPMTNHRSHFRC